MNEQEALSQDSKLKVEITPFSAWMIGVGCIIGSMAWLIHPSMLARAGVAATLAAWLVAAVVTLPLALILMELSSMFPTAGGPYVYKYYALKRLIPAKGEFLGFLSGWLFWIANTVGLACIGNGVFNLTSVMFFGLVQAAPIWYGPVLISAFFGLITALNFLPVGKASRLNDAFTVMKFVMAFGFVSLVVVAGKEPWQNLIANSSLETLTPRLFFQQLSSVSMLALAGYSFIEATGCTSYETEDARKVVPRALILTLCTVTVIYFAMSLAICAGVELTESVDRATVLIKGTTIEANCIGVAKYLGGVWAGRIFACFVILSTFACGFVAVLGLARVSYSMALTNLFPSQFARLDQKTGVPRFALSFQLICLVTIAVTANLLTRTGIISDAYTFLVETFGFMYAFVAIFYGICVVSLRYTDPDLPRPFRIGKEGNALVICLAAIVVLIWGYSAFCCVSWKHQIAGLFVLLAGIPVFKYYRRH